MRKRVPRASAREMAREGFAKALPGIIDIASNHEEGVSASERIRALDVLGKYGLGELRAVVEEEVLRAVAKVFSPLLPADTYRAAIEALVSEIKESG